MERTEMALQVLPSTELSVNTHSDFDTSGASLGSIPIELGTMIVGLVDASDLAALRLCCKHIAAPANTRFAQTYFTSRHHCVSKRSFRALVDITAHPVYGPTIRRILIGTTRYTMLELSATEVVHSGPHPTKESLKDIRRSSTEQQSFLQSSAPLSLLTKALINVKRFGNDLTLGIAPDVAAVGKSRILQSYGSFDVFSHAPGPEIYRSDYRLLGQPTSTARLALLAIHQSNLAITGFMVSMYHMDKDNDFSDFDRRILRSTLSSVRSLTWHGDGQDDCTVGWRASHTFTPLLRELRLLEDLHVQAGGRGSNSVYDYDRASPLGVYLPPPLEIYGLKHLTIEGLPLEHAQIAIGTLTTLIELNKGSLSKISLCNLFCKGPFSWWADVLKIIFLKTRVQSLSLQSLTAVVEDEGHFINACDASSLQFSRQSYWGTIFVNALHLSGPAGIVEELTSIVTTLRYVFGVDQYTFA